MCRYCVVLLTAEANKLSKPFDAFLSFALANTQDTVRFVHVYSSRQQEFASTLLPDIEAFQGKSGVSHGPQSSFLFPLLLSWEYCIQSPDIWKPLRPGWNIIQTSLHPSPSDFISPMWAPDLPGRPSSSTPMPSQLSPLGHFPLREVELCQPFPTAFPRYSIGVQKPRGPFSKSQATGDVLRNFPSSRSLPLLSLPTPQKPEVVLLGSRW